MVTVGIIHPAKAVRIALENAASVAGLLIMTKAMIADTPGRSSTGQGVSASDGMGGIMQARGQKTEG